MRKQHSMNEGASLRTSVIRLIHVYFSQLLQLVLLCLTAGFATGASAVACPGDTTGAKECERQVVYRIQTWPGHLTDANNVRMDSLAEANAADVTEFRDVLVAYGKNQDGGANLTLALRFEVWRLVGEPRNYCNCNFEVTVNKNTKACRAPISKQDLKLCVRACWDSGKACNASGLNTMKSGGYWYAFPRGTEYSSGRTWAKNVFKVTPVNADWSASAPRIKRADCLAQLVAQDTTLDIDALFTDATPCPDVTPTDLTQEAVKRD